LFKVRREGHQVEDEYNPLIMNNTKKEEIISIYADEGAQR